MLENNQLSPENVNQTESETSADTQTSEPNAEASPDGVVLDEYDQLQREQWDWESPSAR